jgi:DASS family divalent anion:Na+ symporter
MMAGFLTEFGLMKWFTGVVGGVFRGLPWVATLAGLALVYFYTHYFFAGNSSHASAMYVPFLGLAIAAGAPALVAALLLGYLSSLFAGLTHYGTAPAPIFFGAGYVPLRTWWALGLIVSIVNLIIWFGVGSVWWKILGYL